MQYIDTHSHYIHRLFNGDRDALIKSLLETDLEYIVELPWNEYTKDNFDLKHAQKVLDKDHFGLEKIKDRIIEYLAVLKLKNDMKSPILCLVGPPGVGKTTLASSIAKALNRDFQGSQFVLLLYPDIYLCPLCL